MADPLVDKFNETYARTRELQQAKPGTAAEFKLAPFIESAVWSIPELFGVEPPFSVERWRAKYPFAGLASELIGVPVPYGIALKGATAIPKYGKLVKALEKSKFAERAPVRAGALSSAAKIAPLEAARIGSTAYFQGGEGVADVLPEIALDLGLFGVAGGIGGAWRAAAGARGLDRTTGVKIQQIYPEFDLNAPVQLQLRQLRKFTENRRVEVPTATVEAGADAALNQAEASARTLERIVRLETPKGKHITKLAGVRDQRSVERLFKPSRSETLPRRQLVASTNNFASPEEYRQVAARAGLPEGYEQYVQFPRYIRATQPAQEKLVKRAFRDFTPIGQGYRVAREVDDGLYVMAKRIGEGEPGTKAEWLLFKTDRPTAFVPGSARFGNVIKAKSAFAAVQVPKTLDPDLVKQVPILADTERFLQELPFEAALGIPRGKPEIFVKAALERLGLGKPAKEGVKEAARVKAFLKEYLAPAMHQFTDSRRAAYLHNVTKYVFDNAAARTETEMFGALLPGRGSGLTELFGLKEHTGGIKKLVDNLDEEDLALLRSIWEHGVSPEDAAKAGASDDLVNFLKRMNAIDERKVSEVAAAQELFGESALFKAKPHHYMISRTWKGEWRTPIEDDAGNLVWIVGSNGPKAGLEEAKKIVQMAPELKIRRAPQLSERTRDVEQARLINFESSGFRLASRAATTISKARAPKFFKERHDIGGFIGATEPFTHKELMDVIGAHVSQMNKYLAEMVVRGRLGEELLQLADENPDLYRQLVQRINDRVGKPTPAALWQNQITEKVLAPYMGKNPATKIVRVANTLMMNYQLGMANMTFPIINAATFMQTVLPQMAFIMTASPERLARYYTYAPVAGSNGLVRGAVGTLSIPKMMVGSFKELIKPSKILQADMRRAATEGVTDPRFVEEYVGQRANLREQFRATLRGDQGYIQLLKAVSEWLPGQSEKFARGHAFTVGHMLGRDFMRLDGERLYQFSKEFTEKTMYLYSTADRARLITGPVGSLFGMFKNWQMHYMAQMLLYGDEAFLKGNFAPLLWQTAGTASLAGVQGLPLYSVANVLSEQFSDKSLMENIYDAFGYGSDDLGTASDAIFMGLPAFLGVSVGASAAAPGSDIARDASMLTSFVHYDRLKFMGKAFGAAIDSWSATGDHPIQSNHVRDLFARAFLPKTFYRSVAVAEDTALRSLNTGNPVLKDLPMYQRVMFGLGLTPQYVEKAYAVSGELWRNQQKRQEAVSRFGRAWAEAQQEGDWRGLNTILIRAMASGIDLSSVMRSANARMAKGREDQIERQFDPRYSLTLTKSVLGRSR